MRMYVQQLILISVCMFPFVSTAPGDDKDVYFMLTLRHTYLRMIPEYSDVTSPQFWHMKLHNEPTVNHLMDPAFGDKFASFSIVGIRENPDKPGYFVFDMIVRLKSSLDVKVNISAKIINIMKNHRFLGDSLAFKSINGISNQQCIVDGVTHTNGETFKTNTCIKCMCINGIIKCMSMNCSDVWINEACTRNTCRMKYAECKKGVCECPRWEHQYYWIYANCTEGVDLGHHCLHHTQCRAMDSNTECGFNTNVCECASEYTRRDGETKCLSDLHKSCDLSWHCRQNNTKCQKVQSLIWKCQCKDEFYEKDGECHKKEPVGIICTTTTHVCAKNSKCIDNKCQCIQGASEIGGYCYFERHYGEVCEVNEDCRENNTYCTHPKGIYPKTCVCKSEFVRNKESTSCTLKLTWQPKPRDKWEEDQPMATGLIVIIIVCVIGGLIIIATPIVWWWRKNKRGNRAI